MRLLIFFVIASAVSAQTDETGCGEWSEWTGDCRLHICGLCDQQSRRRVNTASCIDRESTLQNRNCLNYQCSWPCDKCIPGCKPANALGKNVCLSHQRNYGDDINNFKIQKRYNQECPPAARRPYNSKIE